MCAFEMPGHHCHEAVIVRFVTIKRSSKLVFARSDVRSDHGVKKSGARSGAVGSAL